MSVPDLDGFIPSPEEFKLIETELRKKGTKLLYRVSSGKTALIYSSNSEKIGIVPEDNVHGFPC